MEGDLKLPPGFRFHPTDEELVMHYLVKKCASQQIDVPIVADIDLYKYNPWELPDMAVYGEKEWYFFSPRERKYPNGSRPNRGAGSGYWKATGADKPISQPKVVGIKKSLVFYAGKAPNGEKSDWIMHEYRLANVDRSARNHKNSSRLDEWVLCRIYNKKGTVGRKKTPIMLSPIREEEKKPDVNMSTFPMNALHEQQVEEQDVFNNDLMQFDTSDSNPKLHTDSSSSDHAVSPPELTAEVQSQPRLFGEDVDRSGLYFPFNYMAYPQGGGATEGNAGFQMSDRFEGNNNQTSLLQDMFMGILPY